MATSAYGVKQPYDCRDEMMMMMIRIRCVTNLAGAGGWKRRGRTLEPKWATGSTTSTTELTHPNQPPDIENRHDVDASFLRHYSSTSLSCVFDWEKQDGDEQSVSIEDETS